MRRVNRNNQLSYYRPPLFHPADIVKPKWIVNWNYRLGNFFHALASSIKRSNDNWCSSVKYISGKIYFLWNIYNSEVVCLYHIAFPTFWHQFQVNRIRCWALRNSVSLPSLQRGLGDFPSWRFTELPSGLPRPSETDKIIREKYFPTLEMFIV